MCESERVCVGEKRESVGEREKSVGERVGESVWERERVGE